MELRWAAADLVIFLDVNRFACLTGAVMRDFNPRPDGPKDFDAKFDRRFFQMCKAIWNFKRHRKDNFLAPREKYPNTEFFVIKGRREMHRLLREWEERKTC